MSLSVLLTEEQNSLYLTPEAAVLGGRCTKASRALWIGCGFLRSTWNMPVIQLSWHMDFRPKPSPVFAIKLLLINGSGVW